MVLDLQEANKDVLVGKRNVNCLSCGIKENAGLAGQSTVGGLSSLNTINGKDGRVYRGIGQSATTFEMTQDALS